MQGWGRVLQEADLVLSQHSIDDVLSVLARSHRSRHQGVEMGVEPLTITPNDIVATFLLPVPIDFMLCWPAGLTLKGGMLPPEDATMIPLNWKIRLPPSQSCL